MIIIISERMYLKEEQNSKWHRFIIRVLHAGSLALAFKNCFISFYEHLDHFFIIRASKGIMFDVVVAG